MDRRKALEEDAAAGALFESIHGLNDRLGTAFREQFNRSLPFTEAVFDRWERAASLGFGGGTGIYDSSFVFGDVQVGANTWIGPYTIIDGSGGLTIGDHCTISAGVHIYSHDNVAQTLTGGKAPIERHPVTIGDRCYIGPQSIIAKGLTIGECCVIGAGSFVNKDVPPFSVAAGTPAKVIGRVHIEDGSLRIEYFTGGAAVSEK